MTITALSACTYDTCPIASSTYGYRPSQGVSFVFLFSFISSFAGLQLITLYTKQWFKFSMPMSIACLFEVVGYAVRIASWNNPWDVHLYAVTEFFLTIAPALITSSIYLVSERTLLLLGQEHSIINPRWYPFFILSDIVSLAVQLVGLSISMWTFTTTNNVGPESDKGGWIIAMGMAIHALTTTIFLTLFAIALVQAVRSYLEIGYTTFSPEQSGCGSLKTRFKLFLTVLFIGILCLLARDVYRTIGFLDGFDGGTRVEGWFALFDGLMVSEAVLGFVVLHPAYVFTDYSKQELDTLGTSIPINYGKLVRQAIV